MTARLATYLGFARPFTLLPPIIGMVSGSVTAVGAYAHRREETFLTALDALGTTEVITWTGLGALLAASLNAGSNILNQWTDLEGDRINKPHRPLPRGAVTGSETALLVAFFYGLAVALAACIRPDDRWHTLWIVLGGAACTIAYSVPPLRTKRFGTAANLTIAVARGCLLKVCGWSCVLAVFPDPEPWFLGGVFALFLVGAAATKDYADMEGDRAAGCRTWPIAFGPRRAAFLIAPFLVVPWLFIPLGAVIPGPDRATLLTGNAPWLTVAASLLAVYGAVIAASILRDPDALAERENHPAWTHVYVQMMLAQLGLMAAYVL